MKASTIELNQKDKKKKSTSLPASSVEYLKAWMMSPEHVAHPYPTEKEKAQIMADTGIELKQLTNWFVNNRKRYWKPRVEARLKQQVQAQNAAAVAAITSHQRNGEANRGERHFMKYILFLLILQNDLKSHMSLLFISLFQSWTFSFSS
jgi:2-polyprenyl-3-methyl-5-hydroxy-6-metoxy-1,4-benzoquinol methylase